jgi:hypothetical protein
VVPGHFVLEGAPVSKEPSHIILEKLPFSGKELVDLTRAHFVIFIKVVGILDPADLPLLDGKTDSVVVEEWLDLNTLSLAGVGVVEGEDHSTVFQRELALLDQQVSVFVLTGLRQEVIVGLEDRMIVLCWLVHFCESPLVDN